VHVCVGTKAAPIQREEWMTKPMASSLLGVKKEEADAQAAAAAVEEEKRKQVGPYSAAQLLQVRRTSKV